MPAKPSGLEPVHRVDAGRHVEVVLRVLDREVGRHPELTDAVHERLEPGGAGGEDVLRLDAGELGHRGGHELCTTSGKTVVDLRGLAVELDHGVPRNPDGSGLAGLEVQRDQLDGIGIALRVRAQGQHHHDVVVPEVHPCRLLDLHEAEQGRRGLRVRHEQQHGPDRQRRDAASKPPHDTAPEAGSSVLRSKPKIFHSPVDRCQQQPPTQRDGPGGLIFGHVEREVDVRTHAFGCRAGREGGDAGLEPGRHDLVGVLEPRTGDLLDVLGGVARPTAGENVEDIDEVVARVVAQEPLDDVRRQHGTHVVLEVVARVGRQFLRAGPERDLERDAVRLFGRGRRLRGVVFRARAEQRHPDDHRGREAEATEASTHGSHDG